MNKLDIQYIDLARHILSNGHKKSDRTGTGTMSTFGYEIRHKMREGFPLLTTKKMAWNQIVSELLWLLRGHTNIKWLVENGNNIWVGDAYKKYCDSHTTFPTVANLKGLTVAEQLVSMQPIEHSKESFIEEIKNGDGFAMLWGDLGPIYGKQWRNWKGIDQISVAYNTLRNNPDSRRIMVNAWNVADLDKMTLPPCHYGFQFYTRELNPKERLQLLRKAGGGTEDTAPFGGGYSEEYDFYKIPTRAISLLWTQRSVDVPLGLPFNIASYGLLLSIFAHELNMVPEELIGQLGDCHIYNNQREEIIEQTQRTPKNLPTLRIDDSLWNCEDVLGKNGEDKDTYFAKLITSIEVKDFELQNYDPHPKIIFPLSN